mmetsp:Transcript_2031/g.6283  ORF Transcript_2031/g.6283 Transcript_2031/m.6283 type:complete len:267 (-) Transcript_2031:1088-1888(-)
MQRVVVVQPVEQAATAVVPDGKHAARGAELHARSIVDRGAVRGPVRVHREGADVEQTECVLLAARRQSQELAVVVESQVVNGRCEVHDSLERCRVTGLHRGVQVVEVGNAVCRADSHGAAVRGEGDGASAGAALVAKLVLQAVHPHVPQVHIAVVPARHEPLAVMAKREARARLIHLDLPHDLLGALRCEDEVAVVAGEGHEGAVRGHRKVLETLLLATVQARHPANRPALEVHPVKEATAAHTDDVLMVGASKASVKDGHVAKVD